MNRIVEAVDFIDLVDGLRLRQALDSTQPTKMERAALDHLLTMQRDTIYRWEEFAKEQGVDFMFVADAVMKLINKGVIRHQVVHNKAGTAVGVRITINYDFSPSQLAGS